MEVHSLDVSLPHSNLFVDELRLQAGKLYHLYGTSDSGATEFLYLLAGLKAPFRTSQPAESDSLRREERKLADEDLTGIRVDGEPLFTEYDPVHRAQLIGLVFRDPEWSILGGTVLEEFYFSFRARDENVPSELSLKRYDLYEKRDQETNTLSGGEMHRLSCATALEGAYRKLLLIDLSSSNLDSPFVHQLLNWLSDELENGVTVVIHGLRKDRVPSNAETIFAENGCIEHRKPSGHEGQFPSLESQTRTIQKRLDDRNNPGARTVLVVDSVKSPFMSQAMDFAMREGEIILLTGPNGSGKTTLGRLIVDDRMPPKGNIYTEDTEYGSHPVMSFQHPEHCFFRESVSRELPSKRLRKLCGIEEHGREHPSNIPLSKQKLLSIAVTLYMSDGLAVLDEPTCGMDYDDKLTMVDLLNQYPGLGILIISHDDSLSGIGDEISFSSG